ncbi:hypothetical protein SADUNF_Sadunf11G0017900 [Salix dunnii]|uniref:Uncharacterized protein n=1 Tax=Salix dunnii TaxID=1413687 RepID=A0A835JPJ8_9ROSI|nr:hypothetical protein SADUNF_Sadunf11G0017900 [Salix dunnii]
MAMYCSVSLTAASGSRFPRNRNSEREKPILKQFKPTPASTQNWSISQKQTLVSGPLKRRRTTTTDVSDFEFAEKLKKIKHFLRKEGEDPIQGLAMIDAIQRLSVDYHFQEEIDSILARQSMLSRTFHSDNNLYEIALRFRLLRQQGYHVSADYKQARLVRNSLDHPHHKSLASFMAKNFHNDEPNGWSSELQELAETEFKMVKSRHQLEVVDVSKWDIAAAERLPDSMKICFKALNNITNEISYEIYKKHGWNPVDSLRKTWTDLCNAFLVEAKWFASGKLPSSEEYLKNGIVSSGVNVVLVHIFFLLGQGISKENVELINNFPAIISSTATILRLWDDLGSAKDENQDGHDGSYVECYRKSLLYENVSS